jgi:ketol-acid reductoisomerase
VHIGDTHSGSTLGIASFTSFANGDTRSGFLYTNHATTLTGFCDRTIMVGGQTEDFLQKVDLSVHRGWNPVVAVFSVPGPGHIVAHLRLGSGPRER